MQCDRQSRIEKRAKYRRSLESWDLENEWRSEFGWKEERLCEGDWFADDENPNQLFYFRYRSCGCRLLADHFRLLFLLDRHKQTQDVRHMWLIQCYSVTNEFSLPRLIFSFTCRFFLPFCNFLCSSWFLLILTFCLLLSHMQWWEGGSDGHTFSESRPLCSKCFLTQVTLTRKRQLFLLHDAEGNCDDHRAPPSKCKRGKETHERWWRQLTMMVMRRTEPGVRMEEKFRRMEEERLDEEGERKMTECGKWGGGEMEKTTRCEWESIPEQCSFSTKFEKERDRENPRIFPSLPRKIVREGGKVAWVAY